MQRELDPIELTLKLVATPAQVYRALTSQNELRKWWAPRVIMSKNIVSQEENKVIEMRLMQTERNRLVRYSWRGEEWDPEAPATIITLEINDLGASRSKTGEGLRLDVSHDGWYDQEERDHQERVWKKALPALQALLKGKKHKPWWDGEESRGSFSQVKLAALKPLVEKIEKLPPGGSKQKKLFQAVWKVCNGMDGSGNWYLKGDDSCFEFRYNGVRIFSFNAEGDLTIFWEDLQSLLGSSLEDFVNRFMVEQDMDVQIGKTQINVRADKYQIEIWIQWCQDLVTLARSFGAGA